MGLNPGYFLKSFLYFTLLCQCDENENTFWILSIFNWSILSTKILSIQLSWLQMNSFFLIFSKYGHIISYLSISVSRDESLNPFANGLLSILSLVICKTKGKRSEVLMQFLHFRFHLELTYQVLLFNAYLILLLPCGASGASKAKLF